MIPCYRKKNIVNINYKFLCKKKPKAVIKCLFEWTNAMNLDMLNGSLTLYLVVVLWLKIKPEELCNFVGYLEL